MIVGLTGGIGSGKSAVASRLASYGVVTADADEGSRAVVLPGSKGLDAIASHFGNEVLSADGTLDRKALRALVFGEENKHQRLWLEKLLHPLIGEWLQQQLASGEGPYKVLMSPLLLETSQHKMVDHVVVVDVSVDTQLDRASSRDGQSRRDIEKIIAAQLPREERIEAADTVIDNNGTLGDLDSAAKQLHEKLRALAS